MAVSKQRNGTGEIFDMMLRVHPSKMFKISKGRAVQRSVRFDGLFMITVSLQLYSPCLAPEDRSSAFVSTFDS